MAYHAWPRYTAVICYLPGRRGYLQAGARIESTCMVVTHTADITVGAFSFIPSHGDLLRSRLK